MSATNTGLAGVHASLIGRIVGERQVDGRTLFVVEARTKLGHHGARFSLVAPPECEVVGRGDVRIEWCGAMDDGLYACEWLTPIEQPLTRRMAVSAMWTLAFALGWGAVLAMALRS